MYGWSVTTPEAIGDAKWREMYETWVEDRNHLDIKQKFRDANNLLAYQALVDRMLVAVDKGYWKADSATVANLERVNYEIISEAGVSTNRDTSSSPKFLALAEAQDKKAMGLAKLQPAPSAEAIAANVAAAPPPAPPAPTPPAAVQTRGGRRGAASATNARAATPRRSKATRWTKSRVIPPKVLTENGV